MTPITPMTSGQARERIAAQWATGFLRAVESLMGEDTPCRLIVEADAADPRDGDPQDADPRDGHEYAWLRYRLLNSRDADLLVGCPKDAVAALAALILGSEAPPPETALEAYREVLDQASEAALQALTVEADAPPEWGPPEEIADGDATAAVKLRLTIGQADYFILLVPQPALLAAGGAADEDRGTEQRVPPAPPAENSAPRNLDMLLDLELDLSVSFGRTELPLDQVVRMTVGSIVQLNRSAADPVDVLVNDSVIARGEVVVIDGNYGVRVTQVASRKERLERML